MSKRIGNSGKENLQVFLQENLPFNRKNLQQNQDQGGAARD